LYEKKRIQTTFITLNSTFIGFFTAAGPRQRSCNGQNDAVISLIVT